jgi:DNA-binding winged helix-turn-helix (wHTH) protein
MSARDEGKSSQNGRISVATAMQICFEECQFDDETRRLWRKGEPVHLTPKAFDLLRLLIESRPRALSKDELRQKLWPDVVVDEANLKNLVAEIRAALGPTNVIRTVHRYGYAFEGRVGDAPAADARLVGEANAYRLSAGENVIGRALDCAVVIDLAGVSRRHAIVRIASDGATLEDLGSKNGTWRNDLPVHGTVALQDGDRIRVGGATLVYRANVHMDGTITLPSY